MDKPLISTADLTAAGNVVSLSDKEGFIKHQTSGKTIKLERRGNVYILKMRIGADPGPGFTRPGS